MAGIFPSQPLNETHGVKSPLVSWALIVAGGLLGLTIVAVSTRWGAGLTLDSRRYLQAASDIKRALVTKSPAYRLVHYPPLYPASLAAAKLWNGEPQEWARWLNAILMGVNIAMAGWILIHIAQVRLWMAAFGMAMLVFTFDIVATHANIWSEGLFITFLLLTLIAFHKYLTGGQHVAPLIWTTVFITLACMTRYAGASLILAGAATIALLGNGRKRWTHLAMFICLASVALGMWGLYNRLTFDSATGRSLGFYPMGWTQALRLGRTFAHWWMPRDVPYVAQWSVPVVAGIVVVMFIASYRRVIAGHSTLGDSAWMLLKLLAVFSGVYLTFLLFSITFVDERTPLDFRILSAFFMMGVLFNLTCLEWLWQRLGSMLILRSGLAALCAVLLTVHVMGTVTWGSRAVTSGLGWARPELQDQALIRILKGLRSDLVLYTNEPSPDLERLVDGPVRRMPLRPRLARTGTAAYRAALNDMERRIRRGDALILMFVRRANRYELDEADLRKMTPIKIRARGKGWILFTRAPRPTSGPATNASIEPEEAEIVEELEAEPVQ